MKCLLFASLLLTSFTGLAQETTSCVIFDPANVHVKKRVSLEWTGHDTANVTISAPRLYETYENVSFDFFTRSTRCSYSTVRTATFGPRITIAFNSAEENNCRDITLPAFATITFNDGLRTHQSFKLKCKGKYEN